MINYQAEKNNHEHLKIEFNLLKGYINPSIIQVLLLWCSKYLHVRKYAPKTFTIYIFYNFYSL